VENQFEDVAPYGPGDSSLFLELREVLIRHGAIDRFGITLLHKHFEIREDETLVESVDAEGRTLTIHPEPINENEKDEGQGGVATSWRFTANSNEPLERLVCYPLKDRDGNIVGHVQ
jgi:hypothetical protein